jgi:protein-tyrosine kinase
MSRIHDALRRAQEGKSEVASVPRQHTATQPFVPKPTAPKVDLVEPAVEHHPPAPGVSRGTISGQYLRFDDLLKQCAEPVWQLNPDSIVFSESHSPVLGAEQFRTLRSRLYQLRDTAPLKKVLITSSIPGEGKTFVATNLAQAIACERDRKVLLIDGDLRNASLHVPLGAPVSPGLAEYLRDDASEADIIQHGQDGNLCFVAGGEGGGTHASELLSNGRLQKLLDRVSPLFDWVIVDSPPCVPFADACVLGSFADGVLLVVRASSTPSALVQKARKELQKRNVVGVVLNAVGLEHSGANYYHGYDYPPVKSAPTRK